MMNPGSIMKLMSLKNKFAGTHPKFVSFLNYCFSTGIQEGTLSLIHISEPTRPY